MLRNTWLLRSHTLHSRWLLLSAGLFLAATLSGCRRAQPGVPVAKSPSPASPSPAPPAPPSPAPLPAGGVRGIYLTGWTAGHARNFAKLVSLLDRTELNAMVIDVKDNGLVSYDLEVPLAREIRASRRMIGDIDRLMATLRAHRIFPIARVVCFRDTLLAEAHPELAVQTQSGKVWHDQTGHAWLNPFQKATWDYNIDIALDAVKHGFAEVQFDYVRFPSEGKITQLKYPGRPEGALRRNQISAFLDYARAKIKARGAWLSADVFGLTSLVRHDMGIGQTSTNVAERVDYLCPMVYPSHYALGEYGIKNPNAAPYKTILLSVGDARKRLKAIPTCKLRPWIQDFSLHGVHYGPEQVRAQIKALQTLGLREFLLWNAGCRYTEQALQKKQAKAVTGSAPPPGL